MAVPIGTYHGHASRPTGSASPAAGDGACSPAYTTRSFDESSRPIGVLGCIHVHSSPRNLKPEERAAKVEELTKQRAEVQAKIQELAKQRQAFIDAEQKKQDSEGKGLDNAIITAVREQAAAKQYTFE